MQSCDVVKQTLRNLGDLHTEDRITEREKKKRRREHVEPRHNHNTSPDDDDGDGDGDDEDDNSSQECANMCVNVCAHSSGPLPEHSFPKKK